EGAPVVAFGGRVDRDEPQYDGEQAKRGDEGQRPGTGRAARAEPDRRDDERRDQGADQVAGVDEVEAGPGEDERQPEGRGRDDSREPRSAALERRSACRDEGDRSREQRRPDERRLALTGGGGEDPRLRRRALGPDVLDDRRLRPLGDRDLREPVAAPARLLDDGERQQREADGADGEARWDC